MLLKLFTSDWDSNPAKTQSGTQTHVAGTQAQPKLCLRLEPIWLDSNIAKIHGTWFQDLKKLQLLTSHLGKNLVRDKVIGKKWVYSDTERSTLHRQSVAIKEGECGPEIWHG